MAETPPPDILARIVRWVIILFFGYAMVQLYSQKTPITASKAQPQQTAGKDKNCAPPNPQELFPAFDIPLMPAALPAMRIEDLTAGTGEPAQCGQTAKMRYEYTLQDGSVIFSNLKADAENIRIGGGDLLPGAEQALIGMKAGGERRATMPSILAFEELKDPAKLNHFGQFKLPVNLLITKQIISAKLSVLALTPPIPASAMPVRTIDSRFGNGLRAQCGDTVTADITLWKSDGTKLFSTLDSTPVTFTLGASQVPYGIEQGMLGMMQGGLRTVIVPPAYSKPLASDSDATASAVTKAMPSGEIVLVEMTRLPAVEKPVSPPGKPVLTPDKK